MDKHFDFVFGSQNIDVTVDDNGTAWFQGPQIASILGYVLPSHMYRMLEANEIMTIRNVDGHSGQRGGAQMMNLINEFGVYRLIIASRRPEAKEFQQWLFYQVLPSIRRYGAYIDPQTRQALEADPNTIRDLNQRIAILESKNTQLEDQNAILGFSANANRRRAIRLAEQADTYNERALFYQDLLNAIDAYCFDEPDRLQRAVWDVLDRTNPIEPLQRVEKKRLYTVTDPIKR